MSKKRLYKSTDAVICGVCGGIADYFGIDATLVRIITVVCTIVGLGVPAIVYVVCMVIMPPDPGAAQGYVDARAECRKAPCKNMYAHVSAQSAESADTNTGGAASPPPPNPATRVSAADARSGAYQATGSSYAASASSSSNTSKSAEKAHFSERAKSNWPATLWLGAVLIAIGIVMLLCNFIHISLWRCWPLVLVVAGLVSLFTPGAHGWSLERAGNSIVLITVGIALLLWMLQIVQTRVFVHMFFSLWPVLLVVVGLSIIGSAQKSSAIKLLGSLLLSATIILGVYFYAGLDLSRIGEITLLLEGDGLAEFIADVKQLH